MKKRKAKNKSLGKKHGEYNLKASLHKLNQTKSGNSGSTISDFDTNEDIKPNLNSSEVDSGQMTGDMGSLFRMNESMNIRYDKLKDDIYNVAGKIGDSSDNLRTEIESKLDKKVNNTLFNKLFYGAISVIVAMAIMLYIFSYSGLISDTANNKEDIIKIKSSSNDTNGIDTSGNK